MTDTSTPPTVVRLEDFPLELRMLGGRTAGQRSGVVVASSRDADIAVSLRIADPDLTFENGENEITQIEHFGEGEQREIALDWGLRDPDGARPPLVLLEIDVRYEDDDEAHTATTGVALQHTNAAKLLILGGALAAVAVAATAVLRRPRVEEEDEVPDEIELAIVDVEPPKRPDVEPPKRSPRKASTKRAGGTRRGSSASRSAPRKDARGSSGARKSSRPRSTRKSR
jgi:hypothetical protein